MKKQSIILACIAVILCVICMSFAGQNISSAMAKNRELPIYNVERNDRKIAISFDAAWGADKTRKIVEILQKYDVKATFFLVGFWIDKFPEEVKYLYDSGMEIGNHSLNHLKMSTLDKDAIAKEITSVNDKIKDLTGYTPKVFRPPFGDYNDVLIKTTRELGLEPIQWNVDSLDWKGLSGGQIAKRIIDKTSSGSIILCHNNSDHILDALPMIIPRLQNDGYEFVTMSELIYHENYTIDNNGVQHQGR